MKEILKYKFWPDLSPKQMVQAEKLLVEGQYYYNCKYGINSEGEVVKAIDVVALSDIFGL